MDAIETIKITDMQCGLLLTAIFLLIGSFALALFVWKNILPHFYGARTGVVLILGFSVACVSVAEIALMGALSPDAILTALAIGLGLTLSFLNPVVAVSFSLLLFILRPWEYLPNATALTMLPKGLPILCFISWLIRSAIHMHFKIKWNNTCTIFIFYVIWVLIVSLFDGTFGSFQYFLEHFIPIIVLSFLIFNAIQNREDLRIVEISLIIGVLGIIVTAEVFTIITPEIERLTGGPLLGNSNDLASFVVMLFPLLFSPLKKRGPLDFMAVFITLLLFVLAIYMADSRAAKLAMMFMVFVAGLCTFRITPLRLLVGVVLCSVLLLVSMRTSRSEEDLDLSSSSRLNYAVTGFKMLKSNPLIGVGLGFYPKRYEEFTSNFDEYGERTAHSSWILVMAETGLPGLFLFVLLFLSVFFRAWRIRRLRLAYLVSLMGYGLTMSFLSHTYLFFPYVLYALILAADGVLSSEPNAYLKQGHIKKVNFKERYANGGY